LVFMLRFCHFFKSSNGICQDKGRVKTEVEAAVKNRFLRKQPLDGRRGGV
jgi:hypothetical protein